MGRTLADLMADHVETVFTNTEHFGVEITYRIGSQEAEFAAVPDQSVFDVIATDGSVTQIETRDYLFKPSLLLIDAATRLPDVGHVIVESGRTYKVVAPGGRRCYGYDDEYRLMMRVHTVLVKDS